MKMHEHWCNLQFLFEGAIPPEERRIFSVYQRLYDVIMCKTVQRARMKITALFCQKVCWILISSSCQIHQVSPQINIKLLPCLKLVGLTGIVHILTEGGWHVLGLEVANGDEKEEEELIRVRPSQKSTHIFDNKKLGFFRLLQMRSVVRVWSTNNNRLL